jgi:uncharacterized membrane protein YkvA (DUF1232 family)
MADMDGMPNLEAILEKIRAGEVPGRGAGARDAEADQQTVESEFAEKLRRAKVKFTGDLKALYKFMLDPKAPATAKGVAVAALLYFVLPIDVIPDWIPVLGYADDAAVVAAAVSYLAPYLSAYRRAEKHGV